MTQHLEYPQQQISQETASKFSESLTSSKAESNTDKNPLNLAASWYVAMPSKELGKKPKPIELFGKPLVAWRDRNGQPVIMKRFCSHMGASLAHGEIKDGCIQCPFHHWRFDNSGQCVSIPNVDHIPSTARQTTYATQERYGFIWVWYGTSSPLFPLVEFKAAESKRHNYMSFPCVTLNTKTSVLRVSENFYDVSHSATVHQLPATSLQVTLLDENYLAQQSELPVTKEAWCGVITEAQFERYLGRISAVADVLGIKFKSFAFHVNGYPSGCLIKSLLNGEERFQVLISTTPIAKNHTIARLSIRIKKTGNLLLDLAYYLVFGLQNALGVYRDVPVWNNMNPDEGGVYVKDDQGVLKFRKFYQTWVNKVEVD